MDRGGRCSSVAALRVGRAECCGAGARAPAAWSPRDLDSGEIFFYKALSGGGNECTSCLFVGSALIVVSRFCLKIPQRQKWDMKGYYGLFL
ncbi:unnamed protein product [Leptidea sinapis]|uniref:Uncharacterized protein n=1 Tax=Leptidea sinapis TaxID=189913 RepID=A0A5E4Q9F9_9NEOP|nr:unnamed protein product [Leptidea sinapis]